MTKAVRAIVCRDLEETVTNGNEALETSGSSQFVTARFAPEQMAAPWAIQLGNAMNVTLVRGLVALIPVCLVFSGSVVGFIRGKTVPSFLQLFGAGLLVVVVLTHICEAVHVFPWMGWGLEHSAGHYLDLWSAVLGLSFFPTGYFWTSLRTRRAASQSIPRS